MISDHNCFNRNILLGFTAVASIFMASLTTVSGELDSSKWKFTGSNAAEMNKAVDNDLKTIWESGCPQAPGTSILIDLGESLYVYHVYQTPGKEINKIPRSLKISVGEKPDALAPAGGIVLYEGGDQKPYDGQSKLNIFTEQNLRFQPVKGRYVKMEIGDDGAGQPWAIAEMDIHGAAKNVAVDRQVAVILDKGYFEAKKGQPPSPMKMVAEDLQYYLMELLDEPVRLVSAEEAGTCNGLKFRLVTPSPEPEIYPEPDPRNLDDVSVTKDGNEISFRGLTERAVVYGVYEFLSSQGVRWVYPDAHADIVPKIKSLNLSVLPISYHPPFTIRGFVGGSIDGHVKTALDKLYYYRNGFTFGKTPRDNCFGRAHTIDTILGPDAPKQHPDWWAGPYKGGRVGVACTSNPELSEHISKWIDDDVLARKEKKQPSLQGYAVCPMDASGFCECDRCIKLFGKAEKVHQDWADDFGLAYNYSDYHFYLINNLAERMKKTHPEMFLKTLAYSDYELTPKKIDKLPDNVLVDMCPWWKPLPVIAPQNKYLYDNLKAWGAKCGSLGIWSYVLIYRDTTFYRPGGEWNALIPNAGAIIDQIKFYRQIGVRCVTTQDMGPQNHWPWGFYAWARTCWKPDDKADDIKSDFFKGYYGEAWEPMLKWYSLLEDAAYSKNIDSEEPPLDLFTDDLTGKMRALGKEAEKLAKKWYVKERVAQAQYDLEWSYAKARWKTQALVTYPCHQLKNAPVIDGKLDDAVWQTVPEWKGFRIAATRLGPDRPGWMAVNRTTSFRMGWDDKFVYTAITCEEPDMTKTMELDKRDTKFEYRNGVEIFFAPDAPPFYIQSMICSSGFIWKGGVMKLQGINTERQAPHPDFIAKTSYGADCWTVEARFPIEQLTSKPPQEGSRWPATIVRFANLGTDSGEFYSTWHDMPYYNPHQYFWQNHLEFRASALTDADALKTTETLNKETSLIFQDYDAHRKNLAVFDEHIKGKENLAAKEKITSMHGLDRFPPPSYVEITWKDPVELDAVRINWLSRLMIKRWYSLEYWDGQFYRLIEDRKDNRFETSIHEFSSVKTSRLRMTIWADPFSEGWHDRQMLKSVEVFKR